MEDTVDLEETLDTDLQVGVVMVIVEVATVQV